MAEITFSRFAQDIKRPVEELLAHAKAAGLPQTRGDQSISREEKEKLREYLRRRRGGAAGAPRKITLKRKNTQTIRAPGGGMGRGKSVEVEFRKKRTYVNRKAVSEEREEPAAPEAPPIELVPEEPERAPPPPSPEQAAPAPAAPQAAAAPPPAAGPAPPPGQPEAPGRGRQPPRRGRPADRSGGDPIEDRKKRARQKPKAQPERRGAPIKVNDDFVLEDEEFEVLGRGRRAGGVRRLRTRTGARRHAFEKPTEPVAREITIGSASAVDELARKMSVKASDALKALAKLGAAATADQTLDRDTATLLVQEMGHRARFVSEDLVEERLAASLAADAGGERVPRAPVVTVMGHVDHGKTSLLDRIRRSSVAAGEAGGITQHIGAYHVETGRGMITFLDTPGHEAFTAMRSRGAQATDVVVLVVAADDGVKPQTEEAIRHARAAEAPLVVAINKIDKEGIDLEKVRGELVALEVIPEQFGGDVQFVEVSAQTGAGIDGLLEAILLQAELLELKAAPGIPGRGVVVESRLDKGRGPVATVLVRDGTLNSGDMVLAGLEYGRVRALADEAGRTVRSAGPAIPVELLGLGGAPEAGDEFAVVADERMAREVADFRRARRRDGRRARPEAREAPTAESLFALAGSDRKTLKVLIKADVRGSLEAVAASLRGLATEEVGVDVVGSGVGGISGADAGLAVTAGATIIGFNVRADRAARDLVEREGVNMRYYSVIYDVVDDARAAMSGMLAPDVREEIVGVAEVRDVFTSPKYGLIAGSMVVEGTVYRSKPIRVLRDDVVIFEGELESLRRFKDDAAEVRNGMECGIGVRNYKDVKIGDKIEVYETTTVARSI